MTVKGRKPESVAAAAAAPPSDSYDQLWDEAKDHIFPWGIRFGQRSRGQQAAVIAFAVAVTVVWVLGLLGNLPLALVLAWWGAWSLFELGVRFACKPWLKEGPLLRRIRRRPRPWRMALYVLTKNTLVATVLVALMMVFGTL
jgi:NosR/NirI family nitrous oxide reductase transcriptional regulator